MTVCDLMFKKKEKKQTINALSYMMHGIPVRSGIMSTVVIVKVIYPYGISVTYF